MPSTTTPLAFITSVVLALISTTIFHFPTPVSAFVTPLNSTQQTVHLCYLYFGVITDLGWTYSYNAGRLNVHDTLSLQYPNTTFKSTFTENMVTMTSDEMHDVIVGYVTSGCDIILSNNAMLMNGEDDVFAASYPNVSFILLDEYRMTDYTYPNRIYIAGDFTGGYYAAGVAAGHQAKTCIGFLAAWSMELDPTNAWAGFLLGVRSVNTTLPVHVVPKGSWADPLGDLIVVDAYVDQLGCDVIGRYSDPFDADVAISSRGDVNIFSMGSHSDLERFVGDSVLVSVYIDWTVVLMNVLPALLNTGVLNQSTVHFYGLTGNSVVVSDVTPRAPISVAYAVTAASNFVKSHNEKVVCGVVPLRRGGYVMTNTTPNTTCKVPYDNIGDLITDAYVIHDAEFIQPSTCPPGTRFFYDAIHARSLVCLPCTSGTFSTVPGSATCNMCPDGTTSSLSGTSCVTERSINAGEAVGIAIGAFCAALLISAAYINITAARDANAAAPRAAPLCLIFVGVEASAAITKLCGAEMAAAKSTFLNRARSVIQRNMVYETNSITGEHMVIACPTAVDAVGVAVELQEAIALATWPPMIRDLGGLKPRIAVQLCKQVKIRFHPRSWRYVYEGVDVEAGRALVELAPSLVELAPSGAILADQATMDAAMGEDEFRLVLAYEVAVKLWRAGKSTIDMLSDVQYLLGSVSVEPSSTAALRVRLESTNLYALDSKQLTTTTVKGTAVPVVRSVVSKGGMTTKVPDPSRLLPLEGTDPELDQSMHSSFDTNSSLTLGKTTLDIGPPEVALALYGMFQAAEELSPERKKKLLALISEIFSLEYKSRQLSSRRVAAALAFRILDRGDKTTAVDGPTTAASAGSAPNMDDSAAPSRRGLGPTSGDPSPKDGNVVVPSNKQNNTFSLTALEAISAGRLPEGHHANNPFTLPPALQVRQDDGVGRHPPLNVHGTWTEESTSPRPSVPRARHPTSAAHIMVLPGGQTFQPEDSYSTVSASQREVEMLRLPSASIKSGEERSGTRHSGHPL
ncbi:bacterial-type basic membrane lipoprotein, putative [Bodo saltans]|uniref:Bacterial-type basic membrane lipoprotein, putative n=1 Tax=Bodo saltans TaxID=75058 RepID=A0A0S4KH45_BODSA|nr:bacterial-type basic membrane lipoprotein, putative [Bodo saltans]|eukprot:CUI14941.1 bacterial-type basic membrane lipoprotein, putative [Bodo saltans]